MGQIKIKWRMQLSCQKNINVRHEWAAVALDTFVIDHLSVPTIEDALSNRPIKFYWSLPSVSVTVENKYHEDEGFWKMVGKWSLRLCIRRISALGEPLCGPLDTFWSFTENRHTKHSRCLFVENDLFRKTVSQFFSIIFLPSETCCSSLWKYFM